jgi:DNA-directed RNA polymerase subunit RPC12/RpoP
MCETKIEFKCVNCGMLYNPNEELDCPECEEKIRTQNHLGSNQ